MNINGKTALYGIVGNPVSHSLSPLMQNRAFKALDVNAVYVPFEVADLNAALTGLKGLNVAGASVTIPYKEAVIPLLDSVDTVAAKIGAVNTIQRIITEDGNKLHGANTDWLGANRALLDKVELSGSKVVLLGAGGAAKAIGFGLLEAGADIVLCNRTESRGRPLALELDCEWVPLGSVNGLSGDILINATSVGMEPQEQDSLVAGTSLPGYDVVMDIVYSPLQTRLLREAAEAGCLTVNGLEMLLYQGVAQFEMWTGLTAPVEIMRKALFSATGNEQHL